MQYGKYLSNEASDWQNIIIDSEIQVNEWIMGENSFKMKYVLVHYLITI